LLEFLELKHNKPNKLKELRQLNKPKELNEPKELR